MPVQLMNCTLPKLMEGQKLTQGALQTPLRMPPQWTFYSDKFLIYFQMASEFLARLLSAVTPPRTGWVSWAVWVRLSPSGMARSAAPGFVSLLWQQRVHEGCWISRLAPDTEVTRGWEYFFIWKEGGLCFQKCGVLFSWDYRKKYMRFFLK